MNINEISAELLKIKNNFENLYEETGQDGTLNVDVDDRRAAYYFTEMDSLEVILYLSENKRYKESLILLRSVFEKLWYFWLMLRGTKFRHTITWTIKASPGKTTSQTRDERFTKWTEDKKNNHPSYSEVFSINKGGREDEIIVLYEFTGLGHSGDKLGLIPPIPNYNFMLYQYDPEIGHLGQLSTLLEGDKYPDITKIESKEHKKLYGLFFYIDNILKNLKINSLIDNIQEEMIRVHYSYLSSFTHPGKNSLEVWSSGDDRYILNKNVDLDLLHELIVLYCSKLMYLYSKFYIKRYADSNPKFDDSKYHSSLNRLESISDDFWFIDNSPTEYDVRSSEKRKNDAQAFGNPISTTNTLYHKNPLNRLYCLRIYQKTGSLVIVD